jgi:hypothetical protein
MVLVFGAIGRTALAPKWSKSYAYQELASSEWTLAQLGSASVVYPS